jgi:thiol-disulfide isomerase/thioredoxin
MSVLSFDDFATEETPATLFSLPDDYLYREPELAVPGRGSRQQPATEPSAALVSPSAVGTSPRGGSSSSRLPRFDATGLDGQQISADDLEGKVVLFDFWATWCKPCIDAIPHLRRLSRKADAHRFVLISVSIDEDEQVLRKLVDDERMSWTQIWDANRALTGTLFRVDRYPTYILFDHEGVEQHRIWGWGTDIAASIDRHVRKALRRAAKAAQ